MHQDTADYIATGTRVPQKLGLTMALPLLLLRHGTTRGVNAEAAPRHMYSVQFAPPTLVGQSNHSDHCTTSGKVPAANGTQMWGQVPCHYWFPISFLQLGTGPSAAFLLGVRRCGDPGGPTPEPMLHVVSRNAGKTYSPVEISDYPVTSTEAAMMANPMPTEPLRQNRHTTTIREEHLSAFSTLTGFGFANGTSSGSLVTWHAALAPFSITRGPARPLTVARLSESKLVLAHADPIIQGGPIMLDDGSALVSTVGLAADAPLGCGSSSKIACMSLFFWACPEPLHAPTEWEYRSRVDFTSEMAPSSAGPNEHDITQLEDGRVLVVFRLDSNKGHFAALSSDNAASWHAPFPTGTWAVDPKLAALPGGLVALSSGRPGLGFWVTSFANGATAPNWQFSNVNEAHNKGVRELDLRYPPADESIRDVNCTGDYPGGPHGCPGDCSACPGERTSTAYGDLHVMDDDSVLLVYDRLAHGWDGPRNYGPGKLGTDAIFTMAITVARTA